MSKFSAVAEGIHIISKYNKDAHAFRADHDQIWAGYFDLPLSQVDKDKLHQLGWFESDNSWSIFT